MTLEMSVTSTKEELLDVSVDTCKRLLDMARKSYNECVKNKHEHATSYWDGYIRAIQHVLEAHGE